MASVWYVGTADVRTISELDWAREGVPTDSSDSWNPQNGYSLPTTEFNATQLGVLTAAPDFWVGAPDGPRTEPVEVVQRFATMADLAEAIALVSTPEITPEQVEDALNGGLVGGSNISVTYEDDNNRFVIAYTGPAAGYNTPEQIQDIVGAVGFLTGGTGVSINYNDTENRITIGVDSSVVISPGNPGADRILFWDASANGGLGGFAWLDVTPGTTNGVLIQGTQLATFGATQLQWGSVRLASAAEASAMNNTSRALTPSNLWDASSVASTGGIKLMRRDAFGRSQIADPVDPLDITNKQWVEAFAASASAATPNVLVKRDANGRAKIAAPAASDDIPNVQWVLDAIASAGGGGVGEYQMIPAVGGTFTSSFWQSTTTGVMRSTGTAPMPLVVPFDIGIDQISFNLTVVAATVGQKARIQLLELVDTTWNVLQTFTDVPIDDAVGEKTISFAQIMLEAGKVYGFSVTDDFSGQAYDTATRVTKGAITGPGVGGPGYGVAITLPVGANTAVIPVNGVPVIRVRRSA